MAVEGKGLQAIFEPVQGELDRFLHWMVGRRASRLKGEGRENLFTDDDIKAAICQALTGDDEDWTTRIRKALPENNLLRDAVCYGVPSRLSAFSH